MKKFLPYLLVMLMLLVLIFWQACQKNPFNDIISSAPSIDLVNATIQGRVINEFNEPVGLATIKVTGVIVTSTDINGFFRLSNVALNRNAGFIQVEKTGYFTGSRTFVVSKDTVNYVQIQLIPKVVAGTFSSASGGTVAVASGGSIDFTGNTVITGTSTLFYTGTVSVSAFFINPSAANFTSIMPGDLRGINAGSQERGLQSFGMMAIELSGTGGEKLQLAPGKTAAIHFPVPATLLSQAPATIPLWYFNDSTGLWKEQGSATLQGSIYSGTVSHFSFWNCDAPFPVIDFQALLKDQNGNPVSNAKVIIQKTKTNISAYGFTDATGMISGKIPANGLLELTVYDKCSNLLFSKSIGPFTAKSNLGTILVSLPTANSVIISGTVVNCLGQPVTYGFISIYFDSSYFRSTVTNGQFSIAIQRCRNLSAPAQIYAADLTAKQQSGIINVQISSGSNNAGQLSACGTSTDQYINYTVDTAHYSLVSPADSMRAGLLNGSNTNIDGFSKTANPPQSVSIAFKAANQVPGFFPITSLYISIGNKLYVKKGTINITISEYGSVGEFITGSMDGIVSDSTNLTLSYPVNMNFRVRRSY